MTQLYHRLRPAAFVLLLSLGVTPLGAQTADVPDSLETAILNLVLPNHPELLARRAARATAEGRLRSAGHRGAPTLSAEIEEIPEGLDLPNARQMRLMLEREFFTGPGRSAERTIARAELEAATAVLELTEMAVRANVRRDLTTWRGWLAVASRLAAEDSLQEEAQASLMTRFSTGDARYVDVLRLRTERLRVRAERAEALRTGQASVRRLEGQLMVSDSFAAALRDLLTVARARRSDMHISAPPVPDLDSLVNSMGWSRYASLRVDLARGLAVRSHAARRTQFTAGLGVQRFVGDKDEFTVGPSLRAAITLPFTVNGSNRAQQAAEELSIAEAEAERTAILARLRTALLLAGDRYAAAVERLEVYDGALLTGAREERESALSAYRTGDLSLLELLDFERALSRAETGRIQAVIDVASSYADIFIALAAQAGPHADPYDSGTTND